MKHTRRGLYKILERLKNRRKRFFESKNDIEEINEEEYDDDEIFEVTEEYIKEILSDFASTYGCSLKINTLDFEEEKVDFTITDCWFFEKDFPGETLEVNVTVILDTEKSNSDFVVYDCSFDIHKKCIDVDDIDQLDVDYDEIGYVDKELNIPAPILYNYVIDREYVFDAHEYEEYEDDDEIMFDYAVWAAIRDIVEDDEAIEVLSETNWSADTINEEEVILGNDPAEEKNLWHFGDARGLMYTRQDVYDDEDIPDEEKEKEILLKNMKTVNDILKDDTVNDKEKEKKMLNLTGMAIRKKK